MQEENVSVALIKNATKLMLNIFESVPFSLYNHHGFQLTMVGCQ